MKKIFTILGLLSITSFYAQFYGLLDVNKIKAEIKYTDLIFDNYHFPPDALTETILFIKPMIMGIDSITGQLKGFPHLLFENHKTGPLTTDGMGNISSSVAMQYYKVWSISRDEIDDFIEAYNNGSVTNGTYTIPSSILTWPAHGPSGYSQQLAPFFDRNSDGIYNPMHGDYPIMKGDKMLYFIMNDNTSPNFNPYFAKIEMHISAWACKLPAYPNHPLNRAVFVEFRFINRSFTAYLHTNVALFAESDIGGYCDDFFQTNVSTKSILFFNGDGYDESCGGLEGYLDKPPLQSFSIVRLRHNDVEITDDTIMFKSTAYVPNGEPLSDFLNFYRYSNYQNWDGSPQTFLNTGIKSRYYMPGYTDPQHIGTWGVNPGVIWNEITANNIPGDRRGMLSSGSFTFRPGDEITATYMLLTSQLPNFNQEALISHNSNEYHQLMQLNYCDVFNDLQVTNEYLQHHIRVHPNPSTENLYMDYDGEIHRMAIYDISGKCRMQILNSSNIINVSELDAGVYIIYAELKEHEIPVKLKFIKQ